MSLWYCYLGSGGLAGCSTDFAVDSCRYLTSDAGSFAATFRRAPQGIGNPLGTPRSKSWSGLDSVVTRADFRPFPGIFASSCDPWRLELGSRNAPRRLNCAPAPVAQLDRVPRFERGCRRFESVRAHHIYLIYKIYLKIWGDDLFAKLRGRFRRRGLVDRSHSGGSTAGTVSGSNFPSRKTD